MLASASPRRQALIALLELPWRAAPADIDEQSQLLGPPAASAVNVAVAKARTVATGSRREAAKAAAAFSAPVEKAEAAKAFSAPVEKAEAAKAAAAEAASEAEVARAEPAATMAEVAARVEVAGEVVVAADTLVVVDDEILGKPSNASHARAMLRQLRDRSHQVMTGVAVQSGDLQWVGVVTTVVRMRAYADAEVAAYIARGEPFDKAGGYAVQDQTFRPVERLMGCYLNVVGLPLCAVAAGLNALGVSVASAGPPPCRYCELGAPLVRSG